MSQDKCFSGILQAAVLSWLFRKVYSQKLYIHHFSHILHWNTFSKGLAEGSYFSWSSEYRWSSFGTLTLTQSSSVACCISFQCFETWLGKHEKKKGLFGPWFQYMAGQLHHMLGIKADYVLGSGKQKETQSGKDHIEIGYSFSKLCPPAMFFFWLFWSSTVPIPSK